MPRIVALDFGTHAVKASLWKSVGRKFDLQDRVLQKVPQNGETIPTPASQLAALDALIDEHPQLNQGGNIVVAAWGGNQASMHTLTLPFTDMAQIRKTLAFAVEDEVPFDLGDMVMGWRVLSQDVQTDMLVALAPRDELSGFIAELTDRGVEPRDVLVDTEVLSCWSGVEPTAILDVGHSRTLLVVASGGKMHSSRAIDVGGWHITRAIQVALECTWDEAEGVKHGEFYAGDSETERTDPGTGGGAYFHLPDKARAAVDQVLALLIAEVRSTLIGVEDRLGLEIDQVRLGGGGSRFNPIAQLLGQQLGVPVYCVVDEAQEQVDEPYLITDGIGAHVIAGVSDLIDLRQGDLAYRSGMNALQAVVTYGGLALTVFTVVFGGYYIWQRGVLGGQIAEIESAQTAIYESTLPGEKIRGPTKAMQMMGDRIRDAETRAAALGSGGEPPTVALVTDLTESFPKPEEVTVDVLHINITPKVIQFDAETTGFSEVAKVEESIKANPTFQQAAKSNEKKKRGKIEFSVQIPLTGFEEEG